MNLYLDYEYCKNLSNTTKQKLCNHIYYSNQRVCGKANTDFKPCRGREVFVEGCPKTSEWCSLWRDIDPFVIFMILRKEKRNVQ